ncbi:MAG: hypothetical protein OXN93_08705 [bacterium]|nr:hypothetical protein [bacterium]
MISGVGMHIQSATGGTWSSPCDALRAAWLKHGRSSSSSWHRSYNAWAAELGCTPLNPSAGVTGLTSDDKADIAMIRAGGTGTPSSITTAPPPKGGPPESDQQQVDLVSIVRPVPVPPGPGTDTDDNPPWWRTAVDWLLGIGGNCSIAGWAQIDPQSGTTAGDVMRAALQQDKNYWAVGALKIPIPGGALGTVYWVKKPSRGHAWEIPSLRTGWVGICIDHNVPDIAVNQNLVATRVSVGQGENGDDVGPPGTDRPPGTDLPGGGVPAGLLDILGPGIPPKIVQRRVCPSVKETGGIKLRMAYNGECYPEEMLPVKWYYSKPKPAPVPWSAGQYIKKGRAAQKKVRRYAENQDLVPHHHEHEHHVVHHRRRRHR